MSDFVDGSDGDFEIFAQVLDPTEAHLRCACLVAGGVPAMLADANLVQTNELLTLAVGGVRILVPTAYMARAQSIIEAFESGDLELSDDEILEDAPKDPA